MTSIEHSFEYLELVIKFNLKLRTNVLYLHDSQNSFQMHLVKSLLQAPKTELKNKLNAIFLNLFEYLNVKTSKKAKYSQATVTYLNAYKPFLKISYLNLLFVELKFQNIDYYIDKLSDDSDDMILNEIFAYVKKIEAVIKLKQSTNSHAIKLLNSYSDDETKLFESINIVPEYGNMKLILIDFLSSYFMSIMNQANNLQMFCQSISFFNLISNLSILHFEQVQIFYKETEDKKYCGDEESNTFKCMRQILYKPLNSMYNNKKAFEYYFKLSKLNLS